MHPEGHNAAGLAGLGGQANPLEAGQGSEPFGDIASKFGENFNPGSLGEANGLGAGQEGLGGLTGGPAEGGPSSFSEAPPGMGGLGGLGGPSPSELGGGGGAGGLGPAGLGGAGLGGPGLGGAALGGAALGGGMPGLGGTGMGPEEARRSFVPRAFVPGRLRSITRGYLQRNPLDDGRSATIVKKTTIPRPGQ